MSNNAKALRMAHTSLQLSETITAELCAIILKDFEKGVDFDDSTASKLEQVYRQLSATLAILQLERLQGSSKPVRDV